MKKIAFLAAIFSSIMCYAQQTPVAGDVPPEQESVTVDYRSNSLFRGRFAYSYRFLHNGHPYWDSDSLKVGDILFDGRLYYGVRFKIDAYTQELVVASDNGVLTAAPQNSLVAWIRSDDALFVNMDYYAAGVEGMPGGYFQQLADRDGNRWYRRVDKVLYTASGDFNGREGIGYDDPNYDPKCLTYFSFEESYYTMAKNGKWKKVSPKKAARLPLQQDYSLPYTDPAGYRDSREVSDAGARNRFANVSLTSLPAGFFVPSGQMSQSQKNLQEFINQENIIAESRNKTYVVGTDPVDGKMPARAKVHGYVRDVAGGEALSGVLVSDDSSKAHTYTDDKGYYSLSLPVGETVLSLSDYSKEDMLIHVVIKGDGGLDLLMRDRIEQLQSAYVSAETLAEHRRTAMGLEKITTSVMNRIPSAFGEGDVLKAVLTLPGVKTAGEASSGFNVRGGSSDQNLILFNEGTIYNPSHMFGIFSAFNPDVIEGVELYKSSIPVRYGGRISSVLDVKGREGTRDRVHGSLGIGILTSHAAVEGPIGKKTTFVAGGRLTYSDWMLKLLPKSSGYSGGSAGFYDINASVTHNFDKYNKLQVFGYYSRDRFAFSMDTTFRYSNLNVAARFTNKRQDGSVMTLSAGYDQYGNTLSDGLSGKKYDSYILSTTMRQGFARACFVRPLGNHSLSYGVDAVYYALNPGDMYPGFEGALVNEKHLAMQQAIEPDLYIGDIWNIGDSPFSLDYGLRYSSFLAFAPAKYYGAPEVRLSGKYSPLPTLSVKAGFNSMNQYIHVISNSSSISPMDTWQLCSDKILPQRGWQGAAGVYWTVAKGSVDISLEGYYKMVDNCLDYKSGAVLQMNPDLPDDLVRTKGKAFGAELMIRKNIGKLTGWLSYTYSRSLLREASDRGVSTINNGNWYPAPVDKPHDVKLVCNYAFTHRYSLSVNLDYSTGRPVTIPVGQYYYDRALRLAYSERNAYRIPDYFRMDVAFNIEPGHYLKAFTHASATIGCYNVTGRRNAYSVYYATSAGRQVNGYMLSVFATQVPYITINLKF